MKLDKLEQRYLQGDGLAAVIATTAAARRGVIPPAWALAALESATDAALAGGDFAAALGIEQVKGPRAAKLRRQAEQDAAGLPLLTRVLWAVEAARAAHPLDAALFEQVAEEFPELSASTVRDWYYEVQRKKDQYKRK